MCIRDRSLFISQPSLSRYIKDLENRLGVQLFQRINNRLILTHAGEKYVETAKKITEMCIRDSSYSPQKRPPCP